MEEKTIDAIHRLMLEMAEVRNKVKTVRDQLKDVMEQNDDYRNAQEELKEYKAKRETAKKALEDDKDFQLVNSELEELKFQMKDMQEILSHHLVTYYSETQATQITDNDGETRQVILSAKIGRPEAILPKED